MAPGGGGGRRENLGGTPVHKGRSNEGPKKWKNAKNKMVELWKAQARSGAARWGKNYEIKNGVNLGGGGRSPRVETR